MDFNDVDAKTAFKMGFLARCSEEGLTGEDLNGRIEAVKQADLASIINGAGNMIGGSAGLAVGLPVAAGLVGGGIIGTGAAHFTDPKIDDETLKSEELANTYRAYANRLRSRKKALQYRPAR
ncbi:hypothetical protein [Sphingorhabdus sp.]|uniref:hypothetical protein n=1 Tax=Sphingorhabdus sp. TaxID=1902408 RepID=UPI00333E9A9E